MMRDLIDEECDEFDQNPEPVSRPRDMLGQRGAMELARKLEKYWHDRGYPAARFWAELVDDRVAKVGTYEIYQVKCNLINGLPPRYRDS
jgi:hypothetical protein